MVICLNRSESDSSNIGVSFESRTTYVESLLIWFSGNNVDWQWKPLPSMADDSSEEMLWKRFPDVSARRISTVPWVGLSLFSILLEIIMLALLARLLKSRAANSIPVKEFLRRTLSHCSTERIGDSVLPSSKPEFQN